MSCYKQVMMSVFVSAISADYLQEKIMDLLPSPVQAARERASLHLLRDSNSKPVSTYLCDNSGSYHDRLFASLKGVGLARAGLCRHDFMIVCIERVRMKHRQGQRMSF